MSDRERHTTDAAEYLMGALRPDPLAKAIADQVDAERRAEWIEAVRENPDVVGRCENCGRFLTEQECRAFLKMDPRPAHACPDCRGEDPSS